MDQNQNTKVKLTFASPFPKPAHALYQGETVRVTHLGDAEGMSPVYNIVDSQGKSRWVSQSEVQIVDTGFLPIGQETLELISGRSSQTNRPTGVTSR